MSSIIYEDKPHYDMWLKAVLIFPIAACIIPALFLIPSDPEETISLLGTAVFIAVVFWAIMPRKYCITSDKVRLVLGGPFSFSISFDTIKAARVPQGITLGINFVTSRKNTVEIVRKKGMSINI